MTKGMNLCHLQHLQHCQGHQLYCHHNLHLHLQEEDGIIKMLLPCLQLMLQQMCPYIWVTEEGVLKSRDNTLAFHVGPFKMWLKEYCI